MKKIRSEGGFTIIIFLALLLMLTLAGMNAVMTSTTEVDIAGNEMNQSNAFYAAEAGLEKAATEMENSYRTTGAAPNPLPTGTFMLNESGDDGAPMSVDYDVQHLSGPFQKTLVNGAYRGLYALATEYEVSSGAATDASQTRSDLRMIVECDLVPLFQFAVFYEPRLEIAPGPSMTLGGRVHSNGDLYIESGNSLTVNSHMTAAGEIFHGRYPGSGQSVENGNVFIMDGSGNQVSMYQSGAWVDANDDQWVEKSLDLWDGMVEDKNHGITELNLPVVRSGDPIGMIKTSSESADSYENKATLKIIGSQAFFVNEDGTESNVTADLTSSGVLSNSTFYDGREKKTVDCLNISIQALNTSAYWPRNGVLYVARDQSGGNLKATRLVNASTLKGGLTVSTKNPLYVKGNYNSTSKKPSSLMTDALTILSNGWNDGDGTLGINDAGRKATQTTVNASYMTGNVPSAGGKYSGGFENLPRFLENWSNVEFKWTGSAIDLWQSEQATGQWIYGGYYTAPNRTWAFDPDLLNPNNLPPGTPLISITQRIAWREVVASQE